MLIKVILREIKTGKFVNEILRFPTLRFFLKLCPPPNSTNRKEKEPFEQQFKVNIGKLDQEYCT